MRVEPLPDIRGGILVERLVKTVRYVADMRRCQYVVQRPEGVRRRKWLDVEYVDRGAGGLLILQHADQSLLFDDPPPLRVDQPGRWLHSLQLRSPYQAACTAAQHQMDRQDIGQLEQWWKALDEIQADHHASFTMLSVQRRAGNLSPNIGRLLFDSASVSAGSVTSQCSWKIPSFILMMSTTMISEPSGIEYRLCTIT